MIDLDTDSVDAAPTHDAADGVASPSTWTPVRPAFYVVTAIAVTAVRWAFSFERRVPHVSPDEPSQLAIARWLAGRSKWNMFDHATWQPGLGTLLTPVYWLTDDGETVVRGALGLNALIGGLAAAILVALLRRLTNLTSVTCAVIAVIVGIAPASLSASSFVWAEPLVSLAFLGTIALLVRWLDNDRLPTAIGALACAVGGYTCHSRLMPLVASTLFITVGLELWRRRRRRAVAILASGVVLTTISAAWTRWIIANVWDDPTDQNTVGAVWRRSQKPVEIAEALLGQVWYQLAATWGVFGLGIVVLVAALRGRSVDDVDAGAARIIAISTLPLVMLSAIFMADRPRPDQFIYGRYNDAVVWPIVALGIAWFAHRWRRGLVRRDLATVLGVGLALLASGAAIDQLHGDAIRDDYGVRGMIAGLLAHVDGDDVLDVRRVTLTAVIGLALITAIAIAHRRSRRPMLATVALASVAIGVYSISFVRTQEVADRRLNGWQAAGDVREIDLIIPPGQPIGVHPVPNAQDPVVRWVPQRQRFQLYQLYLPDRSFVRDRGLDDDVGPYVLAPLSDPDLTEAGARLLWKDPSVKVGLWEEPDDG